MQTGDFKYKINPNKINIQNPIYCYLIGLISTDGYIDNKNSRVCLRMRNEDSERVFNLLKTYLEFTGPIFTYKKVDKELRVSSLELIKNLTELGLNTNKNKIPFLNFEPLTCMKMYIRGLHDGDGNVKRANKKGKWSGGEFRFTNNNLEFQTNFFNWIKKSFKGNINLRTVLRKSGEFYEISTSTHLGKEFVKWFYSNYTEYKLNCKYKKYMSIIDNDIVRTIEKSIEVKDKEPLR